MAGDLSSSRRYLTESMFFLRRQSERQLRFSILLLMHREQQARVGRFGGRPLRYWRTARLRAIALYQRRYGEAPSFLARHHVPRHGDFLSYVGELERWHQHNPTEGGEDG